MTEHDRRLMIKNPADTPTPDDLTQSGPEPKFTRRWQTGRCGPVMSPGMVTPSSIRQSLAGEYLMPAE